MKTIVPPSLLGFLLTRELKAVLSTQVLESVLGFQFWFLHLLALRPWTSYFNSQSLSFFICKSKIIIITRL